MTDVLPHATQSLMLKAAPQLLRIVCALSGAWELSVSRTIRS